ncbi:MAG TPA: metalloregulator ArsR/SmtB family transcription factor [Clostridiales bacterium]|nr:metalloregulator ArsR/SmtB family transcription factor [Clostridiales bacterium]HQP69135.1 metalloregulator ArsR/SmtB family transcription factor [Clostridiales bacterium]
MDDDKYKNTAKLLKVLSDPVRFKIVDIISCREMCACEILKFLPVTQSTLSHHMKILSENGLVKTKKEATWMHYSLDRENFNALLKEIEKIGSDTEQCLYYTETEDIYCGTKNKGGKK